MGVVPPKITTDNSLHAARRAPGESREPLTGGRRSGPLKSGREPSAGGESRGYCHRRPVRKGREAVTALPAQELMDRGESPHRYAAVSRSNGARAAGTRAFLKIPYIRDIRSSDSAGHGQTAAADRSAAKRLQSMPGTQSTLVRKVPDKTFCCLRPPRNRGPSKSRPAVPVSRTVKGKAGADPTAAGFKAMTKEE